MDVMRMLIAQNEKLRARVTHLEAMSGVQHVEEPPSELPFDVEELPPADGG